VLDPQLFERNMLAIASRHGPLCADRLRSAASDPRVGVEAARSGVLVPFIQADGRRIFMHSRFDPVREAERLAETYTVDGFYVFLGLGAAYEIAALLASGRVAKGLVVEYGASSLRAVLERVDLTHVLGDRRLRLLVDPEDQELDEAVSSSHVPVLTGDLVSVPLRSRIDGAQEAYERAANIIRRSISMISDDYSVQSFFGKRWFANIVRNLALADLPTPPIPTIQEAVITAAGPSLEEALPELRARPRGRYLIATDTSLRALLEHGLRPDAVISIDCQHISYYHFSLGLPTELPLFLDLASPPTVARLAARPYFFSSGHPLSRYIASRLRAFPVLDTSGGNVAHAAVSLAAYLGASSIRLYGADFSYPFGKSYARGTYIYPYFYLRQSRLRPTESLFSEFLYRNQSIEREEDADGTYRYVTKPLVAYKERLERLVEESPCHIDRVRGLGVQTRASYGERKIGRARGKVFAAGRLYQSPASFLRSYEGDMAALPEPRGNAAAYVEGLSPHQRDLWTTMLPSAAAARREAGERAPSASAILADTRDWCLSIVRGELERLGGLEG